MTNDELYEEIAALAVRASGVKRDKLTRNSRLLADLDIDGDDAGKFMAAFANDFDVEMEGCFWLRYFDDEGWDMLTPAMVLVGRIVSPGFKQSWDRARDAEREITLGHLVAVAEAKHWIDPGPEHRRQSSPRGAVARTLWIALPAFAALALLAFTAFGAIMLYGLATGAMGALNPLTAGTAILLAGFPLLMAWNSRRNIQRKLASAP